MNKYENFLLIILSIAGFLLIMAIIFDIIESLNRDLGVAMVGVIGSIVGGLIGGFFTYLGVKLTLDKQSENEIPIKLICLNKSINLINIHDSKIKETYNFVLAQTKLNDVVATEIGRRVRDVLDHYIYNKDSIVNEVAHVNGKTYKTIVNRLTRISLISFRNLALITSDFEENPTAEKQIKLLELIGQYNNDIENIRLILAQQSHELENNFK